MKRAEKRVRLVGAGVAGMRGGDPWVAPVLFPCPFMPAIMGDASVPSPHHTSPALKGRYFVKRAGKRVRPVGAGVAGKKGGDPWVALRPVPLPLPTCPPWATQASPLHTTPLPPLRVRNFSSKTYPLKADLSRPRGIFHYPNENVSSHEYCRHNQQHCQHKYHRGNQA